MSGDLLGIGISGLFTAKKGLQTSGHNIANVNTEGFSRQRAIQAANPPIGEGNVLIGTGSYVRSINRVNNEYIEKKINLHTSQHAFNSEREKILNIIEQVFNEINFEGLNQTMVKFFNAFRELSANPDNETMRSLVRDNAKILVNQLHRSRSEIIKMSEGIDQTIVENSYDINYLLESIANVNVRIRDLESTHGDASDLKDERDNLLKNLAEFFEIDYFSDDAGRFIINAKGVGTLVSAHMHQEFRAVSDGNQHNFPAAKELMLSGKGFVVPFHSGKTEALTQTRQKELNSLIEKIDLTAWTLANAVNEIHRQGYVNGEIPRNENGEYDPNLLASYRGVDFFHIPPTADRAAELIDLSAEVKENLHSIVSSLTPNNPGDNRVALAIAHLQEVNLAENGTKTIQDSYLETIGNIALSSSKIRLDCEQSEGIMAQLKGVRERISGVSIDEETANMVKYQHAYDASARVMKVADEMFKAVLGIKN